MKITAVKLLVLEDSQSQSTTGHAIAQVPGLRRIQYTHTGRQGRPAQAARQNPSQINGNRLARQPRQGG